MNRMLNKPPRYSGQHTILESLSSVSVTGTTVFNCAQLAPTWEPQAPAHSRFTQSWFCEL